MQLSDLPPGVSQFDQHINPNDGPRKYQLCQLCGHRVQRDEAGRLSDHVGWDNRTHYKGSGQTQRFRTPTRPYGY